MLLIQALQRAQAEVKESRNYIAALDAQIKLKQERIDELGARDAQRERIEASLNEEITGLKGAIANQQKALDSSQAEVNYLKSELGKTNKKLKSSRAFNRLLIVGIAAVVASRFIFR